MISIKNLHKSYQENDQKLAIFENMNLEIQTGSKNIILGSSGSGKSTFLNLISTLDSPDSGAIVIDGEDISKLNDSQKTVFRREKIGFIFQFFNLIPTINVEENIFLPLELNQKLKQEDKNYALSLLERVGLIGRLKSMPDRLSGGEQQRIAIVRALAHKPRLIIADEPTGNLDKNTAKTIIDIIQDLCDPSLATLVMATHDESLSKIAESIWHVEDKRLMAK